ncbi:carboxymuconolactone decarboxylase family protein [Parvularcula sp. LCG005]|uniref:carboxymuconolactone decarboxylase family protein n=1 Tax=Parvularcula sp. LCG005 TaxID=3078805 RepID=UPI0029424C37|nr:carboxymuconolactone decarboxylase family protein [Parvularcula sp. LCG005]WOI52926.1 carboxymuconolactone decarboxylase family protein [Parvularcula sp. LCG005]
MSIDALREHLPDYAKDIRLNLGSLAGETVLNDQQKWGTFLSCAIATHNPAIIKPIADEVAGKLSPEGIQAAKAAATIMGMNNVYYRFTHMVSDKNYATMPAKLRMQVIANPGVDKLDFELWCLAVSAINGCGMCVDSHEGVVRKGGMTSEMVQTAVRIAAVVRAASVALDSEAALA